MPAESSNEDRQKKDHDTPARNTDLPEHNVRRIDHLSSTADILERAGSWRGHIGGSCYQLAEVENKRRPLLVVEIVGYLCKGCM